MLFYIIIGHVCGEILCDCIYVFSRIYIRNCPPHFMVVDFTPPINDFLFYIIMVSCLKKFRYLELVLYVVYYRMTLSVFIYCIYLTIINLQYSSTMIIPVISCNCALIVY